MLVTNEVKDLRESLRGRDCLTLCADSLGDERGGNTVLLANVLVDGFPGYAKGPFSHNARRRVPHPPVLIRVDEGVLKLGGKAGRCLAQGVAKILVNLAKLALEADFRTTLCLNNLGKAFRRVNVGQVQRQVVANQRLVQCLANCLSGCRPLGASSQRSLDGR